MLVTRDVTLPRRFRSSAPWGACGAARLATDGRSQVRWPADRNRTRPVPCGGAPVASRFGPGGRHTSPPGSQGDRAPRLPHWAPGGQPPAHRFRTRYRSRRATRGHRGALPPARGAVQRIAPVSQESYGERSCAPPVWTPEARPGGRLLPSFGPPSPSTSEIARSVGTPGTPSASGFDRCAAAGGHMACLAQPAQPRAQHQAVHEVPGDQRELPTGLVALRRRHGADRRHPQAIPSKPQQQPVPHRGS